MYKARELPRGEWPPFIDDETFVWAGRERTVDTIIEITLDDQPWLWQVINWIDPERGGGVFKTYDGDGQEVIWAEVMKDLPEADQVVVNWFLATYDEHRGRG